MPKYIFGKVYDAIFNMIKVIFKCFYTLIKVFVCGFCALLPFIICITIGIMKTNLLWFVLGLILEIMWLVVYVIKR